MKTFWIIAGFPIRLAIGLVFLAVFLIFWAGCWMINPRDEEALRNPTIDLAEGARWVISGR